MHDNNELVTFNFNLHKDYVKTTDWGTYQFVRELIANALDASQNFSSYVQNYTVFTVTNALDEGAEFDLTNLFVFGKSSKNTGDAHIGQFGEGFKLAVCGFLALGHEVSLTTAKGTIVFYFDSNEGTLHATYPNSMTTSSGHEYVIVTVQTFDEEVAEEYLEYSGDMYQTNRLPEPGEDYKIIFNGADIRDSDYCTSFGLACYVGGLQIETNTTKPLFEFGFPTTAVLNRDRTLIKSVKVRVPSEALFEVVQENIDRLTLGQLVRALDWIHFAVRSKTTVISQEPNFTRSYGMFAVKAFLSKGITVKFKGDLDYLNSQVGIIINSDSQVTFRYDSDAWDKDVILEMMEAARVVHPDNVKCVSLAEDTTVARHLFKLVIEASVNALLPSIIKPFDVSYVAHRIFFTDIATKFEFDTENITYFAKGGAYYFSCYSDNLHVPVDMITGFASSWMEKEVAKGNKVVNN